LARAVLATGTTLTQRIQGSDVDLWVAWYEALQARDGNRYGVDVVGFGRATALLAGAVPVGRYNKVMNLGASDLPLLDEIVELYRQRSIPCRFDVDPFLTSGMLQQALVASGFECTQCQVSLFGRPTTYLPSPPPEVTVRHVGAHEIDFFAETYARAYQEGEELPPRILSFRADGIRARWERPGWRFYIAFVGSEPAGGALMHVRDRIASLSGGATLPEFRGLGCHRAMLERRLADAALCYCDLVVSRCLSGSISERNMERVGLRVAYTKDVWEPAPFV
jgi:hypothetical protein